MSILPGFKKVKRYIKTNTGYSKLSQWTSSQTVEMDDGFILENKIGAINETLSKKVDGVKGNAESSYRTGNVNITPANIGLGNVNNTADANKSVYSATKLTTSRNIDGVHFDGTSNITHYGTCSTSASTAAKTVSISNFTLITGAHIEVLFSNENTASNPTLNVNGTGAQLIYYNNASLTSSNARILSGCCEFVYSGSYWRLAGNYTMVKGNSESTYRKNLINITKDNIGLGSVPNVTTNNQTPTFSEASSRETITSGDTLSTILGKIKKWYTDLKTVAFTGSYSDLSNKPTIPSAVAVKGNAESSYRTGNVNLTPQNIGASPYSLVENGDFNNMTTPGIYTMRSASANKPASGSYFGLIVLKSDNGSFVEQIAFQESSYNLYIRTLNSSTWSSWKKINDEAENAYTKANNAYNRANSAYSQANTAYTRANNAYTHANNAYSQANYISSYAKIGNSNTSAAFGYHANTESDYCVAIGTNSRTYGNGTIGMGYSVNAACNSYGIAIGAYAAVSANSLSCAIGYCSGVYSNYSTTIGANSSVGSSADQSTAIGFEAYTTTPNSIQLGSSYSLSKLSSRVNLTVTSDERDKADIVDLEDRAVEFLNKIRTIRYVLNHRELYIDKDSMSEEDKENRLKYGLCRYNKEEHTKGTKKGKRIRVGISAQNTIKALQEVYGNSGYANIIDDNFFDLDPNEIPENVENQLSANYEAFIPFLIKAIQEIDTRLTKLEQGD